MKTNLMMAAMIASALVQPVFAQGTLLVAPTRLVIKPGQKSAEAGITNISDKPLRYKIVAGDMVMNTSGTTMAAPTFDYSAKDMLRYMPRVVELAPNARQTIRVQVIRPAGLPDGDYHTHMMFTEEVGEPVSATEISGTAAEKSGMSVEIGMSYSVGIPVIVQQGTLTGEVKLENAALVRDASGSTIGVQAKFNREGNSEGMVRVTGKSEGKDVIPVRNVRIYREVNEVSVFMPFTEEALPTHPQALTLHLHKVDAPKGTPELGHLEVK